MASPVKTTTMTRTVDDETARSAMLGAGLNRWMADALIELYQDYRRSGTTGYAASSSFRHAGRAFRADGIDVVTGAGQNGGIRGGQVLAGLESRSPVSCAAAAAPALRWPDLGCGFRKDVSPRWPLA